MLIFKIGEYKIDNKNLSTSLNQLSKIECEDEDISISGMIISIENIPYILSKVSLNVPSSLHVKDRLKDVNWQLISLDSGNRFREPLTLKGLFDLLIYYYYDRDWNIKVVNHVLNIKKELYKILGVQNGNDY